MSGYAVELTTKAVKEIEGLDKKAQKRVIAEIEALASNSRPPGCEKLQQNPQFYRVRSGNHRIIYLLDPQAKKVIIALVRHRKDAYRGIDKLDPKVVIRMATPLITAIASQATFH
jgi:mRNA interferase RelE/StbE